MKIGIDISQAVYEGTGVAEYVNHLVGNMLAVDDKNEYVLFFSHGKEKLERLDIAQWQKKKNVTFKSYRIPTTILEFLWNRLHIVPIEWLVGDIDVFYTSDWVEPPAARARKITTIHDLSVLKVPDTFDAKIVAVHTRKLHWVKKESSAILCDSKATRDDAALLLEIEKSRLHVVYPGIN